MILCSTVQTGMIFEQNPVADQVGLRDNVLRLQASRACAQAIREEGEQAMGDQTTTEKR